MTAKQKFAVAATVGVAAFLLLYSKSARSQELTTAEDDMSDENLAYLDPRVRAFLWMIRMCEHLPDDVYSGNDYHTYYGGSRFTDLSDHPITTGEKEGIPLPREMCVAAGFPSGNCVSSAAGAYQFRINTWDEMRQIAPRLADFSPRSQDIAAIRLLEKTGALQAILSDDISLAIKLASPRWASLPYSTAQQRPKLLQYALAKYSEGLEVGA